MKFVPKQKQPKACWTRVRGVKLVRCRAKPKMNVKKFWESAPNLYKNRKPRKRVAFRSASMKHRMALYKPLHDAFLWEHRKCQAHVLVGCDRDAVDVHHSHGKVGDLLFYVPWWKAVCRQCHAFIGDNPEAARRQWNLCKKGEWNRMPANVKCEEYSVAVGWKNGGLQVVQVMVPCRYDGNVNFSFDPQAQGIIDMVKRYYASKGH